MIEKHIQETIKFRTDLKELPFEMWAELVLGFDGSGNNFTVIYFMLYIWHVSKMKFYFEMINQRSGFLKGSSQLNHIDTYNFKQFTTKV